MQVNNHYIFIKGTLGVFVSGEPLVPRSQSPPPLPPPPLPHVTQHTDAATAPSCNVATSLAVFPFAWVSYVSLVSWWSLGDGGGQANRITGWTPESDPLFSSSPPP